MTMILSFQNTHLMQILNNRILESLNTLENLLKFADFLELILKQLFVF